jgi:hypothetical protein
MQIISNIFNKIDSKLEQLIYDYYNKARIKRNYTEKDNDEYLKYVNKMITSKDYIKKNYK